MNNKKLDFKKDRKRAIKLWLFMFPVWYIFLTKDILDIIIIQLIIAFLSYICINRFVTPKEIEKNNEDLVNSLDKAKGQYDK